MNKEKFLKWFILSIAIAINLFIIINAFINGNASAKESNGLAQTFANILNFLKKSWCALTKKFQRKAKLMEIRIGQVWR